MSARDELAEHLTKRMGLALAEPLGWIIPASVLAPVIDGLAADLQVAGYRKPRTIATVQELHALPNGSVVRDEKGFVFEKDGRWWAEPGTRDKSLTADIDLPTTVLFEPEPAS